MSVGLYGFCLLAAGFGKTRCGAQWVIDKARQAGSGARIALVGATAADARDVMVRGNSGILACSPPWFYPSYEPSKRLLTWPNGAIATTYSADSPDRLRGPQHNYAWCLVGDTRVLMGDGSQKALKKIRPGDTVWTRQGPKRVAAASLTQKDASIVRLRTTQGHLLEGTATHPVWINGRGFIPMGTLRPGMVCITAPKGTAQVAEVVQTYKAQAVYDLAVEGAREFFANGVLVHNCDELAAWRHGDDAWNQLMLGLRLGGEPQCVVTTTPRPIKLLKQIMAAPDTHTTRGTTYDNLHNLAPTFKRTILAKYEGTRIGAQELRAELREYPQGALWTPDMLEGIRVTSAPPMRRVVVGVDPAVSSDAETGNNTGIIGGGIGNDGLFYVLEDATLRDKPHIWAKRAAHMYHERKADRLVAEVNQGGDMVETIFKVVDPSVAVKKVSASRGKFTRAEPIAALYEQNRVRHVGNLELLEDELCSFDPNAPQQGLKDNDSSSCDRLDALVWCLSELLQSHKPLGVVHFAGAVRQNPYKDL